MAAGKGNLLWIYPDTFEACKDKATWMETSGWLAKKNWRVTMLCAGVDPGNMPPNVSFEIIRRKHIFILSHIIYQLRILLWVLRHRSILDVVLFHPESLLFLAPLKLLRFFSGARSPKLMMDVRTLNMFQTGIKGWVRTRYINLLLSLSFHIADGVTVITQEMGKHIGLPAKLNMGVWSSGVDTHKFRQAFYKRKWPGSDETVVFIYIGTVASHRNLTNACRAFLNTSQKGYPVKFVVLGGGDAWQKLADEFSQHKNVVDLKHTVPSEQVLDYLGQAHVGVVPHPYSVKFRVSSPLKLFEYMAAGMPTLATDVVCHTSVIGDEDIVFWSRGSSLEALEESIITACQRRADFPEMGARALQYAKNFDWESVTSRLDDALDKVLAT